MLLEPSLRRRAWGGDRLESLRPTASREPGSGPFGESWELADLDRTGSSFGDRTTIARGCGAGRSVHEVLAEHRSALLGRGEPRSSGFPLLLKLLDAASPLSVQSHPSPEYAGENPGADVKHEGWFVMAASPGAVVYRGFRRHLDRSEIREAVATGRLHEELVAEPVTAGDFIWLPSGTCHALGGGLLVAEVQTPSDTTYRVHDWGRSDPSRPLHLKEIAEAVEGTSAAELPPIVHTRRAEPLRANGFRTWDLHRGERFSIELIEADAGASMPVVTDGSAVCWMLLEGSLSIEATAATIPDLECRGVATLLFPAFGVPQHARASADSKWLRIRLADECERSIAWNSNSPGARA